MLHSPLPCPAGILGAVFQPPQPSANSLLTKVQRLFNRDLALQNDYLRQENRILRSKLGARVPLTEADRRVLVKYGLRIKPRLAQVVSIVRPETLLAWNRPPETEEMVVLQCANVIASAFSVLVSQSRASLRCFMNQPKVRSTTQRLGWT